MVGERDRGKEGERREKERYKENRRERGGGGRRGREIEGGER
jgi:hypothetical protein